MMVLSVNLCNTIIQKKGTYPVVIVERHAQLTETGHLPTANERKNVSCEHPAPPSTRARGVAIGRLL